MKKNERNLGDFPITTETSIVQNAKCGSRFARYFQSPITNRIFDIVIKTCTSNKMLNILSRGTESGFGSLIKSVIISLIDIVGVKIDRILFQDILGAKLAFLGREDFNEYRSVLGGYLIEVVGKYLKDWKTRQDSNHRVPPVKRKIEKLKPTYSGWKPLREELQPDWKPFPEDGDKHVKIFDTDRLNPKQRILHLIQGKDFDRVGFGPQFNWAIPFMGRSNNWRFCYDGIETAWAELNVWMQSGGADFMPEGFGLAGYTLPFPDSHSRFFYQWGYPTDSIVPQFIEAELLGTYEDLYNDGMKGLMLEVTKRMIRDTFLMLREMLYKEKVRQHYLGGYTEQFVPYAQLLFATWDILPMWRGMVPFMKDMKKSKETVLAAFELLNKPLTDLMIKVGEMTNAKTALIGNSRGSNSWVSPATFEDIFWPSMKYTFNECFKHDIIPVCHFDNDWTDNMTILAEKLPKRSCLFHLDQVDLVKVHEIVGDAFCLMGGMSPGLLVYGSPRKVEQETMRYVENIGESGLIIASGCEYPADTPIENLYAQKRAIKRTGIY